MSDKIGIFGEFWKGDLEALERVEHAAYCGRTTFANADIRAVVITLRRFKEYIDNMNLLSLDEIT